MCLSTRLFLNSTSINGPSECLSPLDVSLTVSKTEFMTPCFPKTHKCPAFPFSGDDSSTKWPLTPSPELTLSFCLLYYIHCICRYLGPDLQDESPIPSLPATHHRCLSAGNCHSMPGLLPGLPTSTLPSACTQCCG